MRRFSLKEIAQAGVIASVYTVLSVVFHPFSFAIYQVRIAEALTVVPFVSRAAIPGLFAGCAIANVLGSQGWPDIVFGSLLTMVAAVLTRLSRLLSGRVWARFLAAVPVGALWIGGLLLTRTSLFEPIPLLGTLLAVGASVLAAWLWSRGNANRLPGLLVGILSAVITLLLIVWWTDWNTDEVWTVAVGAAALLAAWMMTLVLTAILVSGKDATTLLAPLPPVVVNAIGVPLYLAPMYGLDYWFSVQMVGIGQLIACYLIGLPLLHLINRRRFSSFWKVDAAAAGD